MKGKVFYFIFIFLKTTLKVQTTFKNSRLAALRPKGQEIFESMSEQ